jgi:hypothetical protein
MKQRRIGLGLVLGLLSLLWGVAITEGKGPHHFYFKLKMSEDKTLCPAITEVLAEEYSEHWIQDPPRHEWFIQWEPVRSLGEQFQDASVFHETDCHLLRWAQFDIDNDGRTEIVIKLSGCLGGIRSDTLSIFRSDAPRSGIYDKLVNPSKINQEGLLGELSYTGEWYELKKLPPFKDKRGRSQLHGIGGKVWIHPFLFDGQTYLNLHGLSGMHVIARYRRGENKFSLEDVCYIDRKQL